MTYWKRESKNQTPAKYSADSISRTSQLAARLGCCGLLTKLVFLAFIFIRLALESTMAYVSELALGRQVSLSCSKPLHLTADLKEVLCGLM
jgi:hypothetical protein